jgi:hypothetical protein
MGRKPASLCDFRVSVVGSDRTTETRKSQSRKNLAYLAESEYALYDGLPSPSYCIPLKCNTQSIHEVPMP